MGLVMSYSQKAGLSIEILDANDKPAKVDGVPEWLTDNSDLVTLVPGVDGMSCQIVAKGPIGTCNVNVIADADLGAGQEPLIGVIEVETTTGKAVKINIVVAEQPTEQ